MISRGAASRKARLDRCPPGASRSSVFTVSTPASQMRAISVRANQAADPSSHARPRPATRGNHAGHRPPWACLDGHGFDFEADRRPTVNRSVQGPSSLTTRWDRGGAGLSAQCRGTCSYWFWPAGSRPSSHAWSRVAQLEVAPLTWPSPVCRMAAAARSASSGALVRSVMTASRVIPSMIATRSTAVV
jgi:hypothetical protein